LVIASVDPPEVEQGEVFVVRVRNSSPEDERTVWFAAVPYPMLWAEDLWWSVVGVAADFAPGEHWVEITDSEDGPTTLVLTVVDAGYPEEYIELEEEESALLTDWEAIEAERQLLAATYAVVTPERLWSGPFILPVNAPLGNGFGWKRSFNGGPFTHHTGQDISGTQGQPVMAANSGRVAVAQALQLRGNSVVIDHGSGVFSGYHHLAEIMVIEGQEVVQGDVIGTVGDSGLSTGPHLHWEVIVQGTRVDPMPWTQAEIAP
jgi:murein DD-endopeptidase MepM/ murein hydrolase activator NlpD